MAEAARLNIRPTHPLAWWGWALGVAVAVNLTTNPLLLLLIGCGVVTVVLLRRSDAPWARSLRAYFVLAAAVIVIRLFFQILVGARMGGTRLLDLPAVPLPAWAAGITLGGPVTAEALAATGYDAMRLATMVLCLGAANALANPRQALRSVPAALYEASVAVVIALSVAPQLVESAHRIGRARRLRGATVRGVRGAASLVVPVLEDAIERSMALAAAMETRGFGRTVTDAGRRSSLAVMLGATLSATIGGYLFIAEPERLILALVLLAGGVGGLIVGLRLAGQRLRVTQHRPQPFTPADAALAGCGVAAAALTAALGLTPGNPLVPSVDPLVWPPLTPPMLMIGVVTLLALPLSAAPGRAVAAA